MQQLDLFGGASDPAPAPAPAPNVEIKTNGSGNGTHEHASSGLIVGAELCPSCSTARGRLSQVPELRLQRVLSRWSK